MHPPPSSRGYPPSDDERPSKRWTRLLVLTLSIVAFLRAVETAHFRYDTRSLFATTAARPPPPSSKEEKEDFVPTQQPPKTESRQREQEQCRPQNGSLPPQKHSLTMLVDRPTKLVVVATPKGGATLAAQITFRFLNLTDTALSWHSWIHRYRIEVFNKAKDHRRINCAVSCHPGSGWVCVKLVRSPLDRAVSSYLHTMKTRLWKDFLELHEVADEKNKNVSNASFADFVEALQRRAKSGKRSTRDDHFMAQAVNDGCDGGTVRLVPIEAAEAALSLLGEETGVKLNTTGLTSAHYVEKGTWERRGQDEDLLDAASDLPFPETRLRGDGRKFKRLDYPYEAFFRNGRLNEVLCRVVCVDLELYALACSAQFRLRSFSSEEVEGETTSPTDATAMATIRDVCSRERKRVLEVCGEEYDFFRS